MIDVSLIEDILFSKKYTAKELSARWEISESAIKSYRQSKGTMGSRDWKAISIGKALKIMEIEGYQVNFDFKKER